MPITLKHIPLALPLLFLFFLLCVRAQVSTARNNSSEDPDNSEGCRISQVHFSLGDFFLPGPVSADACYLYFIFQTERECKDIVLEFKISEEKSMTISRFKSEYLGNSSILAQESGFHWLHHFKVPYFNRDNQTSTHSYVFKNSSTLLGKEQIVKIPEKNVSRTAKESQSFLFFGDFDSSGNASLTINYLNLIAQRANTGDSKVQFLMHLGDIAYDTAENYGKKTNAFLDAISNFSKVFPYMIIPGNHENIHNYYVLDKTFHMPTRLPFKNHFFSFDVGLVHFVALNFDFIHDNNESKTEILKWLQEDLANATEKSARSSRPWIVVLNHKPLYCSHDLSYENECAKIFLEFSEIEEMLVNYRVDLFINGHIHFYERLLPLQKGKIAKFFDEDSVEVDSTCKLIKAKKYLCDFIEDPTGPIHISEGIAGNGIWMPNGPAKNEEFSVFVDWRPGVGILEVFNNTHLEYKHILSESEEVVDRFTLIKSVDITMNPLPLIIEDDENTLTYVVLFLALSICFVGILIAAKKRFYRSRESKKLLQYELSAK